MLRKLPKNRAADLGRASAESAQLRWKAGRLGKLAQDIRLVALESVSGLTSIFLRRSGLADPLPKSADGEAIVRMGRLTQRADSGCDGGEQWRGDETNEWNMKRSLWPRANRKRRNA